MEFLTKERCQEFMKRTGLDADVVMKHGRVEAMKNAADFLYESRYEHAIAPGMVIATWFPKYTSAVFWMSGNPWGDGWGENDTNISHRSEWKKLRALRHAGGEVRRVYDVPGHLLSPEERPQIATHVEIAIHTGWDCALVARPNRAVVYCSHNDWISIQSDTNLTSVSRELAKLGFRRKEFR